MQIVPVDVFAKHVCPKLDHLSYYNFIMAIALDDHHKAVRLYNKTIVQWVKLFNYLLKNKLPYIFVAMQCLILNTII